MAFGRLRVVSYFPESWALWLVQVLLVKFNPSTRVARWAALVGNLGRLPPYLEPPAAAASKEAERGSSEEERALARAESGEAQEQGGREDGREEGTELAAELAWAGAVSGAPEMPSLVGQWWRERALILWVVRGRVKERGLEHFARGLSLRDDDASPGAPGAPPQPSGALVHTHLQPH